MTLHETGAKEITLRSEIEFGRRYLELEQIRFGERLTVEFVVAPETLEAYVPNLLIQPFLENAIKHAIAPFSKPGKISIYCQRDDNKVRVRVTDTGPGLSSSNGSFGRPGIGLKNTRARLQELYGNEYALELKNVQHGGLAVDIAIPFRTTPMRPHDG
jgi:sensor histidine kinase YesM